MPLNWFRRVYPPRTFAITLAITILVWFAGPFGTYQAMTPAFRLVYWGGLILGSVPIAYTVRMVVTRRWSVLSPIRIALLTALLFSFVYTPVVFLATQLAIRSEMASAVPLWNLWAGTFLAAACAYGVWALLIEKDQLAPAKVARLEPDHPRLLLRVEVEMRGTLISISVRDHYVDVRTSVGQASLLLRLSDAIAETEGVDGAQVHRSHWVNWDAVEGVGRRGGNLVLRMIGGDEIPVSRNHREKLEKRGLV